MRPKGVRKGLLVTAAVFVVIALSGVSQATQGDFGWWNSTNIDKDGEGLWSEDGGLAFTQFDTYQDVVPDVLLMRVDTACSGVDNCYRYWIGYDYDSLAHSFTGGYTGYSDTLTGNYASYEAAGVDMGDFDRQADSDDALFMTVDDPSGDGSQPGNIWYRVAFDIANNMGKPVFSGGWTDNRGFGTVCTSTGLNYEENCGGGGVAAMNIDSDPRTDILFATVQNVRSGSDNAHFEWYLGLNLNTDGSFAGGISAKRDSTADATLGEFGDGGGVAFAFVNDNNIPDAVFMAIGTSSDSFKWVVAYDIEPGGGFTGGWSGVFSRGGLGWWSDGGGIDIMDIDGVTTNEALMMTIDRPLGNNHFWFYGAHNIVRHFNVEVASSDTSFPSQNVLNLVDRAYLKEGIDFDWLFEETDALPCPREYTDTYSEFAGHDGPTQAINILWVRQATDSGAGTNGCSERDAPILGEGYGVEQDPNSPTPVSETGAAIYRDIIHQAWTDFPSGTVWAPAQDQDDCVYLFRTHADFPSAQPGSVLCPRYGWTIPWPAFTTGLSKGGEELWQAYTLAHEIGHLVQSPHTTQFLPRGNPDWALAVQDVMTYPQQTAICGSPDHTLVECPRVAAPTFQAIECDNLLQPGTCIATLVASLRSLWGPTQQGPEFTRPTEVRLREDNIVSLHTNDFTFFPFAKADQVRVPYRSVVGVAPYTTFVEIGGIGYTFGGIPGSPKISFEPYDIDSTTELSVWVNGHQVADVPATGNDAWGPAVQYTLGDGDVRDSGANTIFLINNKAPANVEIWGSRNFNVGPTIVLPSSVDQTLAEDTFIENAFDLDDYAYEVEGDPLSFAIESVTDPNCGVSIDADNYIDIYPAPNWNGQCTVTVRVSDGFLTGTDSFVITVTPVPDPPGPPLNLVATAGKHKVILTWEPPIDGGGAPITSYRVYRDANPPFDVPPSPTTYEDLGLRAGQLYCYQLSAVNSAGEGPKSVQACATPTAVILFEAEGVWTESISGDTLVRAVYSTNVDADPAIEILAVGEADIGPPQPMQAAQLTIWSWTGSVLTQEADFLVLPPSGTAAAFHDIYAEDFDGDGVVEIFAAGWGGSETVHLPLLCRFRWNVSYYEYDGCLTRTTPGEFLSVTGAELGGDAAREVIVAGRDLGGPTAQGWLLFFTWNGTTNISDEVTWTPGNETAAYSVYTMNVDGDPWPEVMTAGSTRVAATTVTYGELRVWEWTGSLQLQAQDTWFDPSGGSAEAFSVFAATANPDGTRYILTCGFGHDQMAGEDMGMLRVYQTVPLQMRDMQRWADGLGSRCQSVYGENLADDPRELEFVTGGWSTKADGTYGELRVWRIDVSGSAYEIALKQWRDHGGLSTVDVMVNGVFARDVDGDGVVEIVTGGQGLPAMYWEAQLRIWYDP